MFQELVGCTGVLIHPTRGPGGPGEVQLRINGSNEAYLATSDEPLARGLTVLVVHDFGHRKVVVVPWVPPPGADGTGARPVAVPPDNES